MVITAMDRPDLIKVRDLITNKESMLHANWIRPFKHPKNMPKEKIDALTATDLDEFMSKIVLDISGAGIPRNGNFVCVGLNTSLKTRFKMN